LVDESILNIKNNFLYPHLRMSDATKNMAVKKAKKVAKKVAKKKVVKKVAKKVAKKKVAKKAAKKKTAKSQIPLLPLAVLSRKIAWIF